MKLWGKVILVVIFAVALLAAQQGNMQGGGQGQTTPKPRLSPPGEATYTFADGKTVFIAYSRPLMRGRKIMGDLVPYGKIWRTGANEATSLKTTADLDIGGLSVPAGSYTIYTLPGENAWKLIVNKQTGQWGTVYDEKQDLGRVDMNVGKLGPAVEQFTIKFEKTGEKSASLILEWENTRLVVAVQEK